ncbi:hypothetical protein ILYODFUR_002022 [Ilyodon furcidens]|uniref:Uncharacterized protein n=1 Tax=Ilyodon furcidens TaxID=33524 RepID=A0ABV0TIY0_9TELE
MYKIYLILSGQKRNDGQQRVKRKMSKKVREVYSVTTRWYDLSSMAELIIFFLIPQELKQQLAFTCLICLISAYNIRVVLTSFSQSWAQLDAFLCDSRFKKHFQTFSRR